MTRSRSLVGCWTCRLRRKKCDEGKPICENCSALEIQCFFGDDKPEWMDGGKKQRDRADWLKSEVKRMAERRRVRRLRSVESEVEDHDMVMVDVDEVRDQTDMEVMNEITPHLTVASFPSTRTTTQDTTPRSDVQTGTPATTTTSPNTSTTSWQSPQNSSNMDAAANSAMWSQLGEIDMNFLMLYLDYVFPFLFPFYRPPFLHSGRGWLLNLLTRNKSLLHCALGVASHFWTVVTYEPESFPSSVPSAGGLVVNQTCKQHSCEEMAKQQELLLQELQRDMEGILLRGGIQGHNPVEASRLLASIVQVLTFEVAVANTGNWQIHLDAAVEVFSSIMDHCSSTSSPSPFGEGNAEQEDRVTDPFSQILAQLGHPPIVHTVHNRPWSSDQASFRFFTACLLYYDTLASTSLDQPPRLQRFHSQLLLPVPAEDNHGEARYPTPHISLSEFLGIQNWVIIAIGQISALSSWKKSQRAKGQLSVTQLVSQANKIETYLRENIATLDISFSSPTANATNTSDTVPLPCPSTNPINPNPLGLAPDANADPLSSLSYLQPNPLNGLLSDSPNLALTRSATAVTYIFTQASLTYLNITTSGWQPLSPEIRSSVKLTLSLLKALPTKTCIRTLIWPFTITGCLALDESEENVFREFVDGMGAMSHLGSLRSALQVMEGVWDWRKGKQDAHQMWDIDFGSVFSGAFGGNRDDLDGAETGMTGRQTRVLLV
ncbi:Fungal specific transcription factor domain containing protein [Naviculisporaceae sp. PSN 640]